MKFKKKVPSGQGRYSRRSHDSLKFTAGCLVCIVVQILIGSNSAKGALPSGWTNQDIGAPLVAGSAFYGSGNWTNSGSGADIWSTSDQFNFSYQNLSGDGSIVARVLSQSSSNTFAQTGVMIRSDDSVDAAQASTLVTPSSGVLFRYRTNAGGATAQTIVAGITAPVWLRLSRSSNICAASYSTNGIAWVQIGTPRVLPLNDTALAGLAVTAHTNTPVLNTATISSVLVVPGPQAGVPTSLTNPFTGGIPFATEVTWPLPQLNLASNALRPRMGWNSWFTVGDALGPSETLIKQVADAFVSNGLASAGYQYVVIDCSWISASGRGSRDTNGNLIVSASRWPSGMKAVADYVHSKGLLMGGYSDIGFAGYGSPAQIGGFRFYQQDADQFAAWGWDFIKIDDHGPGDFYAAAYAIANNSAARPIVLSLSTPQVDGLQFASRIANSFRVHNDISFSFGSVAWSGIITQFDSDLADWYAQAPGHWNDPDMLCTGMNGINDIEGRSHFNMWAILGAPLMLGTDPRTAAQTNGSASLAPPMTAATLATITNSEVITIDQDDLGAIGRPVTGNSAYAKPLGSYTAGVYAVLLLNRSASSNTVSVNWGDVGLIAGSSATVRDLWAHQDLGAIPGGYTSPLLPPHGSMMLKVTGTFDWNKPRTYEAEWGYNTLTGNAYFVPHASTFSATAYVTGVGNGMANTLQLNKVAVSSNGLYEVDVYYACAVGRTAQLSVNGGPGTNITFQPTGGDLQPGSIALYLQLNAGENFLVFSNATGSAPNFDKIVVSTGAPTGLTATAGDGLVNLSWAAQAGATSYNVYRGIAPGAEDITPIATGLVVPSYTDMGLTNGQTYFYTVKAFNLALGGETPPSNEASARPRYASTSVAYQSALLAATPYAYWRLNETNGATANDYLGTFNGSYGNAVTLNLAGPRPADFLGFELTNTAVQLTNNVANSWLTIPALNLNTNAVTITAWIYPMGPQAAYTGLVFCRSGSTTSGMNYNGAGTDLGYTWNDNGSSWGWNSGVQPPSNQWSLVAVVVKSNNAAVYVKSAGGQQSATNTLTHPNQAFAGSGTIGTDTFSSAARVFNGLIDEVAIFKYSMTPTQIQQLYDNGHQLSQVQLLIQPGVTNVSLNWPQGTLFQADTLAGPWSRVTNALSPLSLVPIGQSRFYRVLLQQ